ncbi:putative T-complex protein 1 subunit alpha [Cardiosporidium cionae]|uniref:T-complex protein 1 subunit alpha n=1 Tax=Cardiosporidium cionae TaxID=476202 RepID=A0ABQ7J6G5_9APIC|nr:putative T-complex protein 1 subunit alpha [Cardiosporidium cionae]|eukprot:KAF8819587.1 putative T-complex protein 1 subunit alpha [Cardiosporidium cionae]
MSVGILGERESGPDVRTANITAVQAVGNILKSSLGPQGLDKMLVDDIGDVIISNDGATILQRLEIQHPAAKILVDLSELQDKEVGDGTTSVVLLASELLKLGNQLVKSDLHPTSVISGYKLAMKECVKYIRDNLSSKVNAQQRDFLADIAKTALSSKFIGVEDSHYSRLIVDAILSVKTVNNRGDTKYPVSSVNILKNHGKSSKDSYLVDGYALKIGRSAQGMPSSVKGAKVALLDFNLRQHRMQRGVNLLIDDPQELEKIRQKEKDVTRDKIKKILASGANVILTTNGIDDMALKYFVEAKTIAIRRVEHKDIRRIAKITGGTVVLTLATLDGEEKFDSTNLGYCEEVYEDRVGDWDYLFFKGCKASKAATIILRGPNEYGIDEVERSVHDALCGVSRSLEFNAICPGGGAVETALSLYLEDFARTLGSREQLAVAAFAEALLVIPKTLAVNAAHDATDLLAKLRACHSKSQTSHCEAHQQYKWYGLDLIEGTIRNSLTAGVIENQVSKIKSIRFATEAAVTLLRIDDFIKISPEPEKPSHHD